jgi:putative ABC transport system ATP-binding protein
MDLIKLTGIQKSYHMGDVSIPALRDIDLTIARGEFIAVCGPSGSGKSTLCNLIGLLDDPDVGSILFEGQYVSSQDDDSRSASRLGSIGFVFQSFNLVPVFSALENVLLPLQLRGHIAAAMRAQAKTLLASVGLAEKIHRRPKELSGGQQQRVAIARALITQPSLVIADEPTANLDTDNALAIIEIMRTINQSQGTTFVFSTHDERLLGRVERRVHLCDGLITEDHRGHIR